MILNLIILVALVWAFMVGYSRGLILQVIYSFGTIIAAFIAASNYKELAIIRLIGLFLHFALSPLGRNGKIIAGILGFAATYFGLQMVLMVLSLVPIAAVQSQLDASILARFMVLHTPISSGILQNLFIENIVHINPLG